MLFLLRHSRGVMAGLPKLSPNSSLLKGLLSLKTRYEYVSYLCHFTQSYKLSNYTNQRAHFPKLSNHVLHNHLIKNIIRGFALNNFALGVLDCWTLYPVILESTQKSFLTESLTYNEIVKHLISDTLFPLPLRYHGLSWRNTVINYK